MKKTFKLIATTHSTDDGKTFIGYRAVRKDGTLIQCRFRKECNPPTETSMITVDSDNMNVSHKKEYPILWVSEIDEVEPVRSAKSSQEVEEMF